MTAVQQSATATAAVRDRTPDLLRVMLFTGVVLVHAAGSISVGPDIATQMGLLSTLGHCTRYGFVAVTAGVLILSIRRDQEMSPIQFWRKRFGLVVLPYVVWTVLYTIFTPMLRPLLYPDLEPTASRLMFNLLRGEGQYHLYFLLISMQIYLAFPALLWLLRKTQGYHWFVLAGSAAVQVLAVAVDLYFPHVPGTDWVVFYENWWKTLPMYAFYLVAGALIAWHRDAVAAWISKHRVMVLVACTLGAVATIANYLYVTADGSQVKIVAAVAWRLENTPWIIAALVVLMMGCRAAVQRAGPVANEAIHWATMRAFGVFAVHPFAIDFLTWLGFTRWLDGAVDGSIVVRVIVFTVVVMAVSLAVVDILMRTPLSRILVARPRIPLRKTRSEQPI